MATLNTKLLTPFKTHPDLDRVISTLVAQPRRWLVTGAAGFIGSHLVEQLLTMGQTVVGLDNFSTGSSANLDEIKLIVGDHWQRFTFIEGDICDAGVCEQACKNMDFVLHHAALGSVPRSIALPLATNANNVTGFINILTAAKNAKVSRFIYASSSSVYGDNLDLPKVESKTGKPLSPYAVTKVVNELYARTFSDLYGIQTIGLRYFNVFGARQSPEGEYAAVIPRWITAMVKGESVNIFGDGETSRDFCYVKNAVQMNLLAAMADKKAVNRVFNTACNQRTSLNHLYNLLRDSLLTLNLKNAIAEPIHLPARIGDIHHSLASIVDAQKLVGYQPLYNVPDGIAETIDWYSRKFNFR